MRVKTKGLLTAALFAVLFGLFAVLFMFAPKGATTASAATVYTPTYNLQFGYSLFNGRNLDDATHLVTAETDINETKELQVGDKAFRLKIRIWGSFPDGTTVNAEKGGYINSMTVNIEVSEGFANHYIKVSYAGRTDAFATRTIKKFTLVYPESEYEGVYEGYTTLSDGSVVKIIAKFRFCVDTHAPEIEGGSELENELYTNKGFTISATDNLSGIKAIYMKSPNSNSFVSVGTESKTVSKGSVSGLYTFYAEDKAGNKTEYRYVNFDSTSPEIKCIGAEFGTSSSSGFKVTATDDSGTVTLYRKMDDGNWIACGDSYTVNENADDGKYYFYAVDGYNNQTAEVWILLGGELYGEFVKSNTDNSVYFTWGRSSWTATLDGISYVKETWIMDEGNHTMKLSSNGNSAVYNFSIEHNYIAKSTTATCTQGGSTVYECNQCGNEYIAYSTEETGHYYVASTVAATCTDGGFTVYTCTRCGDNYIDNETRKLGHSYTPRVIMATCTDGGHTQYTCSRCGDGYRSGITQALGHSYVTSTHAATCEVGGYTLHRCYRCDDSYKDNESQPLGHNFVMTTILPTCTEYGKTVYNCQVCGKSYEDNDGTYPTGHDYTNTIIIAPNCTDEGLIRTNCDNCGEFYDTRIAENGHNYVISDITSNAGITTRTYTCIECGHSYKQELGDQYEEVTNYVEYLFEQYVPYMWWVLLAVAGVWSIVMGVFFAIAQKNEDKEKSRKMIINYVIGLVVIAVIIVACPFLIRGIAALVT